MGIFHDSKCHKNYPGFQRTKLYNLFTSGAFKKAYLDRQTCGTYFRYTIVDGLSVLCEAVNEWRLSQVQ